MSPQHAGPVRLMRTLATVSSVLLVVLIAAVGTAALLSGRQIVGQAPEASSSAAIQSASEVPDPEPTRAPASESTSAGLTEDQAVIAAREAAPQSGDLEVSSAKVGTFEELLGPPETFGDIPPGIPGDRMVWVIVLGGNGPEQGGSIVVIDFLDGRLYKVWDFLPQ